MFSGCWRCRPIWIRSATSSTTSCPTWRRWVRRVHRWYPNSGRRNRSAIEKQWGTRGTDRKFGYRSCAPSTTPTPHGDEKLRFSRNSFRPIVLLFKQSPGFFRTVRGWTVENSTCAWWSTKVRPGASSEREGTRSKRFEMWVLFNSFMTFKRFSRGAGRVRNVKRARTLTFGKF